VCGHDTYFEKLPKIKVARDCQLQLAPAAISILQFPSPPKHLQIQILETPGPMDQPTSLPSLRSISVEATHGMRLQAIDAPNVETLRFVSTGFATWFSWIPQPIVHPSLLYFSYKGMPDTLSVINAPLLENVELEFEGYCKDARGSQIGPSITRAFLHLPLPSFPKANQPISRDNALFMESVLSTILGIVPSTQNLTLTVPDTPLLRFGISEIFLHKSASLSGGWKVLPNLITLNVRFLGPPNYYDAAKTMADSIIQARQTSGLEEVTIELEDGQRYEVKK